MQSILPGRGIGARSFTDASGMPFAFGNGLVDLASIVGEFFDHRIDQQPRVALRGVAHDRRNVDNVSAPLSTPSL